jgi:hypothetical protein
MDRGDFTRIQQVVEPDLLHAAGQHDRISGCDIGHETRVTQPDGDAAAYEPAFFGALPAPELDAIRPTRKRGSRLTHGERPEGLGEPPPRIGFPVKRPARFGETARAIRDSREQPVREQDYERTQGKSDDDFEEGEAAGAFRPLKRALGVQTTRS